MKNTSKIIEEKIYVSPASSEFLFNSSSFGSKEFELYVLPFGPFEEVRAFDAKSIHPVR